MGGGGVVICISSDKVIAIQRVDFAAMVIHACGSA